MKYNAEQTKIIKKSLAFAKKLQCTGRGKVSDNAYKKGSNKPPYWAANGIVPSIAEIKKGGVNCVGLINLMRRAIGLKVSVLNPNDKTRFGDTGEWFSYLKKEKRLKEFNISKSYPVGTLLLRNYNPIDYGHVAVIYEENKKGVLFSKLIHSVGWCDGSGKKVVKIDDSVGRSYFCQYNGKNNKGHYTHICLPEDWLLKN